jgi:hypothetical protein
MELICRVDLFLPFLSILWAKLTRDTQSAIFLERKDSMDLVLRHGHGKTERWIVGSNPDREAIHSEKILAIN